MLQFCSSVVGFELPIDLGLLAVSFFLPGSGFVRKRLFVGNSPAKTLSRQNVQFDFGHVEPTAVLGRVNNLQTLDQPTSFLGRKGFVQGAQAVRVEVVHHQRNPLRLRPMHIDQLANCLGPVGLGALVGPLLLFLNGYLLRLCGCHFGQMDSVRRYCTSPQSLNCRWIRER